jgi:hypothetical protein
MAYTNNGINDFCPVGTILAYIGSNSVDPPGWIIANGVARTDGGTDLKYSALLAISIGAGTNGNYTPPNLQALFLRGIGSQTNSSITYSGSTYKGSIQHNLLTHNHTASVPSHTHATTPATTSTGNGTAASPTYGFGKLITTGAGNVTTNSEPNDENFYPNLKCVTGLIVKNANPAVSVNNNSGNDTGDETRPFNYAVVWIIKL